MSKILVEISARLGSTRLPSKDAYDLGGKPTFVHIFEKTKEYLPDADYYFLNIPNLVSDDPLYFLGKAYGYEVFRGSERLGPRKQELCNYLSLKDDDIIYSPSCDQPFAYAGHIPFIIQEFRETDRNCVQPVQIRGTLGWAITVSGSFCLFTVEGFRTFYESNARFSFRNEDIGWRDYCALRPIILEMPERFQRPWPWARLSLDYPNQAIQTKMIFDLLYKGEPIKPEEIYALFEKRPLLANIVPLNSPITQSPVYTFGMENGAKDLVTEQLKRCSDYRILRWEGGDAKENDRVIRKIL